MFCANDIDEIKNPPPPPQQNIEWIQCSWQIDCQPNDEWQFKVAAWVDNKSAIRSIHVHVP